MINRTRLTTPQKMHVLALIARGDTLSQIVGHLLEDFNVKITEGAISRIKKHHADTIAKMRDTMVEAEAADASKILQRSRSMLGKRMDRAERDSNELDEVERDWREGKITQEEYRRKKAGLIRMSVSELVNISRTMHTQTIQQPPAPVGEDTKKLPPGNTQPKLGAQSPAQLEALMAAIANGNTVEMQRLIFNPGGNSDKSVPVQS